MIIDIIYFKQRFLDAFKVFFIEWSTWGWVGRNNELKWT